MLKLHDFCNRAEASSRAGPDLTNVATPNSELKENWINTPMARSKSITLVKKSSRKKSPKQCLGCLMVAENAIWERSFTDWSLLSHTAKSLPIRSEENTSELQSLMRI